MIKCVAVSVFLPNLLLCSMCLVEHITASEQSKGSANRQVTLPNAPHMPQNEHQSKQPADDIKFQYQHSFNSIQSGCTRLPLFRVLPVLQIVLKPRKFMRVLHESRCFMLHPSSQWCSNPEKSCGCYTNSAFSRSTRNPYSSQTKSGKQPSTAFLFQYQSGKITTLQYPSQTTLSPEQ